MFYIIRVFLVILFNTMRYYLLGYELNVSLVFTKNLIKMPLLLPLKNSITYLITIFRKINPYSSYTQKSAFNFEIWSCNIHRREKLDVDK